MNVVIGKTNADAKPLICLYRFDCEIIWKFNKYKNQTTISHRTFKMRINYFETDLSILSH